MLSCVSSCCYFQSGDWIRKIPYGFLVSGSPDQLTCYIEFLSSAYRFIIFLLDSVFVVEVLTMCSSLCIFFCNYLHVTPVGRKNTGQKGPDVFYGGVLLCFYNFNISISNSYILLLWLKYDWNMLSGKLQLTSKES